MTSQHIETFLRVVRNKSFTKAAQELYITQPAVSRHIRSLEQDLGFVLFDRTCRNTTLTPAGEEFYACFSKCKREIDAAMERARTLVGTPPPSITLGMLTGWDLGDFLPELLSGCSSVNPAALVHLESRDFKDLFSALASDSIDIALSIDSMIDYGEDVIVLPLTHIPHMLIFSSQHPKAALEHPMPQDFMQDTFFVIEGREMPQAVDLIRSYCKPYHFIPKIQTLPNNESMLNNVRNGLGVAIMGSWSRACKDPNFRFLPLGSSHKISLFWKNSNHNPLLPVLIEQFSLLFDLPQPLAEE